MKIPFLILSLFLASSFAATAADRPNIVFAFADDWGRYASAYAKTDGPGTLNDVLDTPNFDRIAREGVLFNHCFVTAPSCTPCRSSLLSGQYFFRTGQGAILQGAEWDESIPSWPLLLEKAGYHCGETYKVWTPGIPRDAPFGGGRLAYESGGSTFNGFSQLATRLIEQGKTVDEAKAVLFGEVDKNFSSFLEAREEGKPFCYWFGPTNVHRKWIQGSGKKLWGIDPDELKGKVPPFLPDVPIVREDLADYFGEVHAFDAALGLLVAKLQEIGEYENTIIVVSGDHGPPGFPNGKCNLYDFGTSVPLAVRWPGKGKPGRIVDDFVNIKDLAPTFLEAGRVAIPEVMTGKSIVPVMDSKEEGFVDPERNWVVTGRERHVAEVRPGAVGYPQRAIRTNEFLYIVNFKPDRYPMGDPYNVTKDSEPSWDELISNTFITMGDLDASPTKAWVVQNRNDPKWKPFYDITAGKRPREELYDLKNDPHQMNNVAGEEKFAEVKADLEARLMAELKSAEDPRLAEGKSIFDAPPYVGPLPDHHKNRRAPKQKGKGKGTK
ncbi:MAG: sulfatase [Verrucomicrobiota bacterium]